MPWSHGMEAPHGMLLAGEVFWLKILAVDDERLALQLLTDAIQAVLPKAEVFAFSKPGEALSCARENRCDIAFLDVRMRSMTGLELARKLKGLCPRINIIFVTGYSEYVGEAMQLHASGYLEKPVTAEKVRREVEDLRHPVLSQQSGALLRAACFGSFEVYTPNGTSLHFQRAKAKECFAYLISRRGASCSVRDLAEILFEEAAYDMKQSAYTRKILSSIPLRLQIAVILLAVCWCRHEKHDGSGLHQYRQCFCCGLRCGRCCRRIGGCFDDRAFRQQRNSHGKNLFRRNRRQNGLQHKRNQLRE